MRDLVNILEDNGINLYRWANVTGGDINSAYAVDTSKGRFFIKLNSALNNPQIFLKEAEGLHALEKATLLKIPQVIATGEFQGQQYIILEWLKKVTHQEVTSEKLAKGLAELHQISSKLYGWQHSNYIGSLIQENKQSASWAEFYATQRVLPLVRKVYDGGGFDKKVITAAEQVCNKLLHIFPPEVPSLIHGDLWGGNFMTVEEADKTQSNNIYAAIFDPAVYFGHREMDLGMTLLFGGFAKDFYKHYNECFPLEKNWRQRVSLTQLYPLLVHSVLFGGSYINSCTNILTKWR